MNGSRTEQTAHPGPMDVPGLVKSLILYATRLLRNELEFAKRDVSRRFKRAAIGVGMIVIAILMAFTAVDVLAAAAVGALTATGLSLGISSLIVGAVLLLVALTLCVIGAKRLDPARLAPKRGPVPLPETQEVRHD